MATPVQNTLTYLRHCQARRAARQEVSGASLGLHPSPETDRGS
jgi:hypothetical protein